MLGDGILACEPVGQQAAHEHRFTHSEPGAWSPRLVELVGRQRELAELERLLGDPDTRLVTLIGSGGVGKTSLGLAVAERASAGFDTTMVAQLETVADSGQVLKELAHRLEVRIYPGEAVLDALKRALRGLRTLLVLDNFEHVLSARGAIAELSEACPQLKLLITSRVPLHVRCERTYEVPGLAYPDPDRQLQPEDLSRFAAAALFVARSRSADPAFGLTSNNVRAVAALCAHFGGLPLALELAAARVRILSPAAILEHVRGNSELLSGGSSDAPQRQQTLNATIDWSYTLLSDEERGLFAVLGVFVGGFAVEAAEAVFGVGDKVVDGIGALLDHGLIRRLGPGAEEPRFGMLEPIRQYALQRLREGDRLDEATRRHAIYYAGFAEASAAGLQSSKQLVWLDALDCEQANLRAVLNRCEALGEIDLGVRVAGAHLHYWLIRDLADEIRMWLERALRLSTGDTRVRARAFFVRGVMAVQVDQLDQARRSYDACLELCQELGDVGLTALCEGEHAFLEACRGGSAQIAADQSRRSLSHAQASGDPWVLVITLVFAATAASRYEEAKRISNEALELMAALGDRIQPPLVQSNLGFSAILAGDLVQARASLEQAAADSRAVWSASGRTDIASNLGLLELLNGHDDEAFSLFSTALRTATRTGERGTAGEALTGLAAIALRADDAERAARLAAAAEALHDGPRGTGEDLIRERYLASLAPTALERRSTTTGHEFPQIEIDALIAEIVRDAGDIEAFPGRRPPTDAARALIGLLMTDIVSSTRRAVALGDTEWLPLLDAQMAASRRALRRFGGTEAKNTGDGLLASFDRPEQAIRCAHAIADASRALGLEVRAGVHIGECDVRGGDVRGIAVHVVARVCALAGAGEVLVTSAVRDLVAGGAIELAAQGEKQLRGVPGSWELFAAP